MGVVAVRVGMGVLVNMGMMFPRVIMGMGMEMAVEMFVLLLFVVSAALIIVHSGPPLWYSKG
jgi:hypothetical protein